MPSFQNVSLNWIPEAKRRWTTILPSRAEATGMLKDLHNNEGPPFDKFRHDQEKAFASAKVGSHVHLIGNTRW